jgi:hypothetical protein
MATKSSHALTDHDDIRRWAEDRGATPSAVRRTEGRNDVGIIRLDFPGYTGRDSLEEIDWDEWFDKFDEKNLALVVQDRTSGGNTSNFNKLVSRDTIEQPSGRSRARKPTSSRSSRDSSGTSRKASARSSAEISSSRKKSSKKSKSTRETARKRAPGRASARSRRRPAA